MKQKLSSDFKKEKICGYNQEFLLIKMKFQQASVGFFYKFGEGGFLAPISGQLEPMQLTLFHLQRLISGKEALQIKNRPMVKIAFETLKMFNVPVFTQLWHN